MSVDRQPDQPREIRDLKPGDMFNWCGRWVEVISVEPRKGWGRDPGLYVLVQLPDGAKYRLHYYSLESVKVLAVSDV